MKRIYVLSLMIVLGVLLFPLKWASLGAAYSAGSWFKAAEPQDRPERLAPLEELDTLPPARTSNGPARRDPRRWAARLSENNLRQPEIFPGVDLVFAGNKQKLEAVLIVKPGADLNAVRFDFPQAESVTTDAQGNIWVVAPDGDLGLLRPRLLRENREIEGGFFIKGERVSLRVKEHDATQPLLVRFDVVYPVRPVNLLDQILFRVFTPEVRPNTPNAPSAVNITASKSVNLTTAAPNSTLMYTVTITNSGMDNATGVKFTDTIDANTSLVLSSVNTSPIAFADAYNVIGNVRIQPNVAQGLLANDCDPNNTGTGSDCVNTSLTVSVLAGDNTAPFSGTSAQGGQITASATDGSFSYNPPAGYNGTDSFSYTVRDAGADGIAGNADDKTDTATVSLTVSAPIWFIDDSAMAGGDGRLTNPFNCLVGAGCFSATTLDEAGDTIFLYAGSYTGGLTLLNTQKLVGQGGSAGTTLAAIHGVTVEPYSDSLPALNGDQSTVSITTTVAGTDAITLGMSNLLRGFTVGNTTASDIAGTNFGALSINEVTLSGTGRALGLNNGGFASGSSITSITSTSSPNEGISLQTITGANSPTIGTTTISGSTGSGIAIATSSTAFTFPSVTINSTGGAGITLTNNTGAFTVSGGQIGNTNDPGGNALDIDQGNANVSIAASLTKTTAGLLVEITNRSGTSTIDITSALNTTSPGQGIFVQNIASGGATTINFSNGTKTLNTGASAAVTLDNIDNATVSFTGGGLDIDTTSGIGFNATGGGTVNVTGTGNAITSTTGTALNVVNTTIGASGLNFLSINAGTAASGPVNGIVLNTTGSSGGLTVAGSGSAGTGGTIQRTTGDGVLLTSTQSVNLSWMDIKDGTESGILGTSITGLNLTNVNVTNNGDDSGDNGIKVNNLWGTCAWSNLSVTGSENNNVFIDNTSGTLSSFTISGASHFDSLGTAFGSNSVLFDIRGTAVLTSGSISGATFQNNKPARGITIQAQDTAQIGDLSPGTNAFIVQNCSFTNNGLQASFEQSGSANNTFKFLNNGTPAAPMTMPNTQVGTSHAVNIFSSSASTGGTIRGRLAGNYIGNAGVAGSGSAIGNGIRSFIQGKTQATLLVDGNVIRQIPQARGIDMQFVGQLTAAQPIVQHDVTVTNNDVNPQDSTGFPANAIYVGADNQGSPARVRADIRGNIVPAGAAIDTLPTFLALAEVVATAEAQLVDTAPASANCTAQLTSTNTGSASADAGCALIAGPINTPPAMQPIDELSEPNIQNGKQARLRTPATHPTPGLSTRIRQWLNPLVASVSLSLSQAISFSSSSKTSGNPAIPAAISAKPIWTGYLDATVNHSTTISPQIKAVRQLWRPVLPAFSAPRSYFNPLHFFERSASAAESPSAKLAPAIKASPALKQSAQNLPTRSDQARGSQQRPTLPEREPLRLPVRVLKSLAGTTITVGGMSGFTLPAGKSVTIMFSVQVNSSIPAGTCSVQNQGRVDYTGGPVNGILTDAPGGGANDPTVTNLQIAPSAITCPGDIMAFTDPGQCTAAVSFSTPSSTGCPTPTVTCLPAGPYPKGATMVTCTAANGVGPNTTCSFNITVTDNQSPTIACGSVSAQSATANASCQATVPDVRALVRAQANDNCTANASLVVTQSPTQGSTVSGTGSHPITVTASDGTNSNTCVVAFTVNDGVAPTIACGNIAAQSATANASCQATVPDVRALVRAQSSDNCTPQANLTVTQSPTEGSAVSGAGAHPITVTVSDGTNSNTCVVAFTVNDLTPPTITCPTNQVGVMTLNAPTSAKIAVNYPNPTVNDNCVGATFNCNPPASGNQFPLGTTMVTCTASDAASPANMASCSFAVVVRTPRAAVNNLKTLVQALVPATLTQAQANSAISHLELASTHLEQGNNAATCTDLANFVTQVNAQAQLSTPQKNELIFYANKIRNAIGVCGGPYQTAKRVGVFSFNRGGFYLKQELTAGLAERVERYGEAGDWPVAGDWDGDGIDSLGVYRQGVFHLRPARLAGSDGNPTGSEITVEFGLPGDLPIVGDWDGDGVDTIGVYRQGQFLLRNSNRSGPADIVINFGESGDLPLAGDWDGDGQVTVGIYNPATGLFKLSNTLKHVLADVVVQWGGPSYLPLVGDWDGDGITTIGLYGVGGEFLLRNRNEAGTPDLIFTLGVRGGLPVAGRWADSR